MPKLTEEEERKLAEILETWDNARMTIHFLTALGRALKWILGVASAIAVIYASYRPGAPH